MFIVERIVLSPASYTDKVQGINVENSGLVVSIIDAAFA